MMDGGVRICIGGYGGIGLELDGVVLLDLTALIMH
jgi:hypothetical protein